MALVTKVREWVEVPHEPGNRFQLQKLSWKQLEDAQETASARARQHMNDYSADILVALRRENREDALAAADVDEDELEAAQQDPLTGYDRFTLLRHGLVGWEGPEYQEKLNDAARGDLDAETQEWACRAILRLTKPELFVDEDENPGNGNGSSTNSSTRVIDLVGPRTPSS